VGVAVVVDPPLAAEINGLRRALGEPELERIAPHVTLVPPLNLRTEDLPDALAVLRRAAATVPGPLSLALGPVATFAPVNPVAYLAVGTAKDPGRASPAGPDARLPVPIPGSLRTVRDAVFVPPLARPLRWPWVPHVTLVDGLEPPERLSAAVTALASYRQSWTATHLTLLEEVQSRWVALADVAFGPPALGGVGSSPVEISQSRIVGPDCQALLRSALGEGDAERLTHRLGVDRAAPLLVLLAHGPQHDPAPSPLRRGPGRPALLGAALAELAGPSPRVAVVVDRQERSRGIGAHLLRHLEATLDRRGWPAPTLEGLGPAWFYAGRSARIRPEPTEGSEP
jgi:2'-5' RNA ligase